ncbi:M48 family metallopeptidase [Methylophaga sp. OBS4]|uniref:M48 family metallopeptidase n=1 Tax=Methylophaga sp. OBS4 TaxID=2991935 RepID=UPI002250AD23|nr:SprT family zinc-dependent metalloprotease [Methylophaga sp. OBS4]MCX4187322.1 M48 family metallopeptidase [Methylophaga sp. OBS4]
MTQIHTDDFVVEIIRSKRRKTLALAVRDATVTIRMPDKLPLHHAEDFIALKTNWIKQKLARHPPVSRRKFETGESFPFLGQSLTLQISTAQLQNQVIADSHALIIETKLAAPSQKQLLNLLTLWYQQQAESYLSIRCRQLAGQTGLQPGLIQVKNYKARWGSCRLNGDIQLNWKLIMAPAEIIDYVIIHELCHLKQHNHSPAFWQLVELFDPDFKAHRLWLKDNGQQLKLLQT